MNQPAASATADQVQWIEIFRAGTHTDMHGRRMEFTEEALREVAANYDPKLSEAPVVVGHPQTNLPAYGWVGALKVEDGKLLYAETQSEPQFDELRRAGRFKKRSASFYLPSAPNNPTPGKLYIRHVGWLGAAAPAVKGLKDAEFASDAEGVVEFEDEAVSRWNWRTLASLFARIREDMIERDGVERADRIIPRYEIEQLLEAGLVRGRATTPYADHTAGITTDHDQAAPERGTVEHAQNEEDAAVTQQREAEFAERQTALDSQARELQEREQRIRDREAQVARDAAVDYADSLVEAGKLLPAQRESAVALLLAFSGEADATLAFSDGDEKIEKPASEVLRQFLDSLPRQIDFSEKGGQRGEDAHNVSFAAPAGTLVDPAALDLHAKAVAHQKANPSLSFADAYKAVGGA